MTNQPNRHWALETAPDIVALEFAHELKNEWLALMPIDEKESQIERVTDDELLSIFKALRDPLVRMRFLVKDAFWYLGNRPKTAKDSRVDVLQAVVHDLLVYLNNTINYGDFLLEKEAANEAEFVTFRNVLASQLRKIDVIVREYLVSLAGDFRHN